jgi:hypothetical protein
VRTLPKIVRIVAADRPDGRVVVRLVDAATREIVRLGGDDGPIHYETVQAAVEACEAEGVEVQS